MNSLPTISVKLTTQRYTCVIDPTLALSLYGLILVKQLGALVDLWVGREFWNILDNTHFYMQHPELLLLSSNKISITREQQLSCQQDILQALKAWEQVYNETGLTNFKLFRLGERPSESLLPQGIEPEIIGHYEFLAYFLADYIHQHGDRETNIVIGDTLSSAFQDTAALAASLDSCFILTFQSPQDIANNLSPQICMAMENWGIPCQAVSLEDEIAAIERHDLLKLIVQAGLAKFLWSGLQIVVLHLLVPTTLQLKFLPIESHKHLFTDAQNRLIQSNVNPWNVAQCFWYHLM
ncbi:hypothetical protein NUACC21_06610 [Scytonema sp. NUACC21]